MRKNLNFLLLAVLLFLFAYYVSPLIDGIVMGIAFAYVAKPVKIKLEKRFGGFSSSIISTLMILLPVSFLMFYGLFQGLSQLVYLLTHRSELETVILKILRGAKLQKYSAYVVAYLPTLENIIRYYFKASALNITIKTVTFFMNFLISAIVCFYVLCDGERLFASFIAVVPDDKKEEIRELLVKIDKTLISLWFGNFAFAVIVGIVSVPFFIVFRVPYIPMFSGLMFLAALIPVFAEWMIILPLAAFLAVNNFTSALWFLLTGVVFLYIFPELVLRPHFVGYASNIHPLLLLLAFIGGAMAGGISGFFIAPMVVATLTAIHSHFQDRQKVINLNLDLKP
ncbi:MAG: AI-2E family transporter [Archaeoglobus sp.]|nr:MAG: AI-2E family transporter [Archaeoglobus sp.]